MVRRRGAAPRLEPEQPDRFVRLFRPTQDGDPLFSLEDDGAFLLEAGGRLALEDFSSPDVMGDQITLESGDSWLLETGDTLIREE